MMRWSTNRTNPAVAARMAPPAMTQQSTATVPIGSREQFRSRDVPQRNAPSQRGTTNNTEDDDEDSNKDGDREPLFSREDDETDHNDGDGSEIDSDEADAADDEADDIKVIVVKS